MHEEEPAVFQSIFSNAALDMPLYIGPTLLSLAVALALGVAISILYLLITAKNERSRSLALSLVIIPGIISVIILLVGGSLARAFSMAGVFALIRFRSVPGDSKDITFVFLTMAAGLATGMGYLTLGVTITLLLCILLFIAAKLGFGISKLPEKRLRITIPEDMNYQGIFDDLLEKYTVKHMMQKVRTTNLGTLYELTYLVTMKKEVSEKDFIDELRCRNGNLGIQLDIREKADQQL